MADSLPASVVRALVRASCSYIGPWHPAAEELLLMIAAHESHLGKYTKQINGPALGIFQMEPATWQDVMSVVVPRRPWWVAQLAQLAGTEKPTAAAMQHQHAYACAIARLQLWRHKEALPDAGDIDALARYAKKYWNTDNGKASVGDYRLAYQERVL